MVTHNKGEWSELYVFLKLLGDGVLYAADADLNKIDNLYYPLIEILRKENEEIKHYINKETTVKITDNLNNTLLELPVTEFQTRAQFLIDAIKQGKGTFSIPAIEEFMSIIKRTKVKAQSSKKSDITLVLHDCKTFMDKLFKFSIKSDLGNPPTLYNSGSSTNFTYEIVGKLSEEQIDTINAICTRHSKIRDRIKAIYEAGCTIKFKHVEHDICRSNLQMVDTKMPEILAEYIMLYFSGKGGKISELTPLVKQINPCGFVLSLGQKYYEHKIKSFLTDIALGMMPATVWDGLYQATGGYIVVREDGEVLCYHIYNHNDFREYMYNNTRLETPSSSKYNFGTIYKENDRNYIKLNLQVRFI